MKVDLLSEIHVKFLYELLCERYQSENVNIMGRSLTTLPDYEDYLQHLHKVVDANYFIWCENDLPKAFVFMRGEDREIGFFVKSEYKNQGVGDRALKGLMSVVSTSLTAVVHPENTYSQKLLQKNGFELVGTLWRKT